jgi:hypothetical protein
MLERVLRVFNLEADLFGEVAADDAAVGQALLVVLGVGLAEGLGRGIAEGVSGLLGGIAESCLRWLIWSVSIHLAARGLGIQSEFGALFRALGFAAAPFALGAVDGIPWLGWPIWLAKWGLGVGAFVVAVRRVLAVETQRALVVCALGLAVALLLSLPLGWLQAG